MKGFYPESPFQVDALREEEEMQARGYYREDEYPVRPPRPGENPRDVAVCIERTVSDGFECLTYQRRKENQP